METNFIAFLVWISLMMLIIWMMPKNKVEVAKNFFKDVLPKIPITGIIEAFKNKKT